ncbi:MAG: hypothetical protein R3B06_32355 [Kofleriaceae bacterium]
MGSWSTSRSRRAGWCAAVLGLAVGCGGTNAPPPTGAAAAAVADLRAALDQAAEVTAPWRCAAQPRPTDGPGPTVGTRVWRVEGGVLTSAGQALVVAVVADAHGDPLIGLRDRLAAARVDVVVSLGGMGETAPALAASLGGLADGRWLTVAVPGASEPWPLHRAEVARLAAAGLPIVDGAAARVLDAGPAVVATLPGEPHAGWLAAGDDGCGHDADEAAAVVAELAARAGKRPSVLASPAAPRLGDSDRGVAGVGAGDRALAATATDLTLFVHAPIDGRPARAGEARRVATAIAAGSLDPLPRFADDGAPVPPSVTLLVFERGQATWRGVPLTPR